MEALLSYGTDVKLNLLRCGLFTDDTGDDLDWIDTDIDNEEETRNPGLSYRFSKTKYSKMFETFGRVHSEIFNQNKMLPGGTELRVKFQRNDPSFCLISKSPTATYTISVDTAILMVRHCKIAPHIRESHIKALQQRNIKYPVSKVHVKFFTRGSGRSDLSEPNLVSGVLPNRVIVGLVRSDSFNGLKTGNPFNFKHFSAQNIVLRKNGTPIPVEEIDLDFENNIFYQGYMSLIQGTGNLYVDHSFGINPKQFKNGYTLYGFDLTPDLGPCNTFNLLQEGKLSLDIKLKTATTVSVTTVAFLEYDSIIELDKEGNIHTHE